MKMVSTNERTRRGGLKIVAADVRRRMGRRKLNEPSASLPRRLHRAATLNRSLSAGEVGFENFPRVSHNDAAAAGTVALRGISLIEMLVYMGVLFVIIGVGYSALYRCMDNSTALRHSADDIANALHAGEDWRADLRAASGNIQIENLPDEQVIHLSGTRGEVSYRFADHAIFRRLANNGWSPLLANVKDSSFMADPRNKVTAWRWELELQPHTKKLSRVTPLFTFIAVPAGDLPK